MNNHQVQHVVCFLVDFLNIFYCLCPFHKRWLLHRIDLKILKASTTQTLISVGVLFVGLSGDIYCNLLQKSDSRLERVFFILFTY